MPVIRSFFLCLVVLLAGRRAALAQATAVATQYEHGTLTNGQPTGVWDYFEEGGQLALRMNYDSSRIAYRRPDTARYELLLGTARQLVRPSRPPGLPGSRLVRREALTKALHYPAAALQQQQGEVLLSYVVQANGQQSDYTVLSGVAPACSQEVWRVPSTLPDRWIPVVYLGQPRAARFYLRVKFEMVLAPSIAAARGMKLPAPRRAPSPTR